MAGSRGGGGTALRVILACALIAVASPGLADTSAAANSTSPPGQIPTRVEDLRELSIEQLGNLVVTTVTKSSQTLREAPAAIYVITHDDIIRSGAASLPEMLRLAPNLQVAQTSATSYVITARGFSGNSADQSFSDKILVLIDGRSVYTPLFSGVYWDMQDVPAEDIDRIEVISGPGASLWGANAVNGVINIITRRAGDTQGGVLEAGIGSQTRSLALQYGGRFGNDLAWRVYAKDVREDDTVTAAGAKATDHGDKPQGGFRLDWTASSSDVLTLQGDAYEGAEAHEGAADESISGRNVLGRWTHNWQNGPTLQVQAYWDRTARATADDGGSLVLDTYDLDAQASFTVGGFNQIVLGGGLRRGDYRIDGTPTLFFSPPTGRLDLGDAFIQDSIAVTRTVTFIAGLKLEDDPYSGLAPLPSLRLSWTPNASAMVWAAASRAIRSPTPFDTDVVEKVGSTVFLTGSPTFQPEQVMAYELGARLQPSSRSSLSVSAFYNVYDDVRGIQPTPVQFIPLAWANSIRGDTWGLEAWSDYKVAPWWRLTASFTLLREQLSFKPGVSPLLGVAQVGDDPRHQAQLRSSIDLGRHLSLNADLRYVDALPSPSVPAYVELNSRLAWDISRRLQVSLSGFNLLHDHHQEFPAPGANTVPRSVYLAMRVRF